MSTTFSLYPILRNEEGVALVTSLLVLVLLALMAPVIMTTTTNDIKRTESFKESRMAFYIAEAGVEQAKANIKASNYDSILAGPDGNTATTTDNGTFTITGGSIAAISGNQYTQVSFNGGTYSVRFYDNDDGDSDYTHDVDGLGYIYSIGVYKNSTKVIRALVKKKNINPASLPAAVTLVGPAATITAQGSGFLVDGNGTTTTGVSDPNCGNKDAVATEASAAHTSVTLGGNADSKIVGVSGDTPDIINNETTFTYVKALALYNTIKPLATNLGVTSQTGGTLGTAASPQLSYVSGDLSLKGNVSGVGILIVDGNLDMQGTINFQGLILIGICPTCMGQLVGTGSATVYGGMVMGNTLDTAAKFTGSANIMYSCQGLNNAGGSLKGTFSVVTFDEVS